MTLRMSVRLQVWVSTEHEDKDGRHEEASISATLRAPFCKARF